MKLCLITDNVPFAVEAERAGVDRIMIDLEREGKAERQAGRGLFLSDHLIDSVARVKAALERAPVVARINPLSDRSAAEIDQVISGGADFIMLPYFFGRDEVRRFVTLVRGRSRVILLVETKPAAEHLEQIVDERGVDEIHIGLNDLSISLGHDIIFEPLQTGLIDRLTTVLRGAGIPFGFGGIARLSRQGLPVNPERILAEQVRVGATRAWLGRTFRGEMERTRAPGELAAEVTAIRRAVDRWQCASEEVMRENLKALLVEVAAWKNSFARC
jgi:hypothetical protein